MSTLQSHKTGGHRIDAEAAAGGQLVTAFDWTQDAPPIRKAGLVSSPPAVSYAAGVRRLTPVECSRLQGFPDTWLELESTYADAAEAHAAQVLRRVWREAGSEAGEGWRPGILAALLTPTILLAGVHGGWVPWPMAYRRAADGRQVQGSDAWPEGFMRRLWEYAQHRPSPHRREPFEQLARELGRSLSEVPPSEASAIEALLRSRVWSEASQEWPLRSARRADEARRSDGRSGATAPTSRVASPDSRRYAAMGDAVTVPVIEWIGRRLLAEMHRWAVAS